MNERRHKWTWDDFRPREEPRAVKEVILLSCLWNCPNAFSQIAELKLEIQFSKTLLIDVFVALRELAQHNDTIGLMKLLDFFELDHDADEWIRLNSSLSEIRFATYDHSSERAVSLARELAEAASH